MTTYAKLAQRSMVGAVLLEHGAENPLVRELWTHVPKEKEKEARLDEVRINAADLVPADRGYSRFEGSLTTPPCARPTQPLHGRVVRETR